jgi:hypothetical protein
MDGMRPSAFVVDQRSAVGSRSCNPAGNVWNRWHPSRTFHGGSWHPLTPRDQSNVLSSFLVPIQKCAIFSFVEANQLVLLRSVYVTVNRSI